MFAVYSTRAKGLTTYWPTIPKQHDYKRQPSKIRSVAILFWAGFAPAGFLCVFCILRRNRACFPNIWPKGVVNCSSYAVLSYRHGLVLPRKSRRWDVEKQQCYHRLSMKRRGWGADIHAAGKKQLWICNKNTGWTPGERSVRGELNGRCVLELPRRHTVP